VDGDLLTEDERQQVYALMQALKTIAAGNDAAAIEAASTALAKGTEGFAAQRMNRGIQQALAGKNIQDV